MEVQIASSVLKKYFAPFVRRIHPDLFARHPHPEARDVNSRSLQQLNALIDSFSVQNQISKPTRLPQPLAEEVRLTFYHRGAEGEVSSSTANANLHPVQHTLATNPHAPSLQKILGSIASHTSPRNSALQSLSRSKEAPTQQLSSLSFVLSFLSLCSKVQVEVQKEDWEKCVAAWERQLQSLQHGKSAQLRKHQDGVRIRRSPRGQRQQAMSECFDKELRKTIGFADPLLWQMRAREGMRGSRLNGEQHQPHFNINRRGLHSSSSAVRSRCTFSTGSSVCTSPTSTLAVLLSCILPAQACPFHRSQGVETRRLYSTKQTGRKRWAKETSLEKLEEEEQHKSQGSTVEPPVEESIEFEGLEDLNIYFHPSLTDSQRESATKLFQHYRKHSDMFKTSLGKWWEGAPIVVGCCFGPVDEDSPIIKTKVVVRKRTDALDDILVGETFHHLHGSSVVEGHHQQDHGHHQDNTQPTSTATTSSTSTSTNRSKSHVRRQVRIHKFPAGVLIVPWNFEHHGLQEYLSMRASTAHVEFIANLEGDKGKAFAGAERYIRLVEKEEKRFKDIVSGEVPVKKRGWKKRQKEMAQKAAAFESRFGSGD